MNECHNRRGAYEAQPSSSAGAHRRSERCPTSAGCAAPLLAPRRALLFAHPGADSGRCAHPKGRGTFLNASWGSEVPRCEPRLHAHAVPLRPGFRPLATDRSSREWSERCPLPGPVPTGKRIGSYPPAEGNCNVKTLPFPGLLSTVTVPAILSAACLTMARPRPVPPVSRERALSTQ